MARIFFLLLALFSFAAHAQVPWAQSYSDALTRAIDSGKNVLVECYHPECHHCQTLNKNLEEPEIYNLVNADFIGFKIDLSKGSDVKRLDSLHFHILSYPVLLFFNQKGEPYNFLEPAQEKMTLIQQLNEVKAEDIRNIPIGSSNDLARKAQFYMLQERMPENSKLSDSLYHYLGESKLGTNFSWNVFKRCVLGSENLMYTYWLEHKTEALSHETKESAVEEVFYSKLNGMRRFLLKQTPIVTLENVKNLKQSLHGLGAEKKKLAILSWDVEMLHYLQHNKIQEAKDFSDSLITILPEAYTYLTVFQFINLHSDTPAFFDYFKKYEEALLPQLKSDREKKIFYEESAVFYGKSGDKAVCAEKIKLAEQFGSKPTKIAEISSRFCQ